MGDRIYVRVSIYGEIQTPEAFVDVAAAIADMDEIKNDKGLIGTGEGAVRQALLAAAGMRAPLRLSGYVWDSRVPGLEAAAQKHEIKTRIRVAGWGGHAPTVLVVGRGSKLKSLSENSKSEATISLSDIEELRAAGICSLDELEGHLAKYDDAGPDFSISDSVLHEVLNAGWSNR